jgi:hypothetical protein
MTVDIVVSLAHILHIGTDGMTESADMVVGMITYLMPLSPNLLVEMRILPHVVAHHEEGGLDIELAKRLKDKGRRFRDGTVVERQID